MMLIGVMGCIFLVAMLTVTGCIINNVLELRNGNKYKIVTRQTQKMSKVDNNWKNIKHISYIPMRLKLLGWSSFYIKAPIRNNDGTYIRFDSFDDAIEFIEEHKKFSIVADISEIIS